jgi:hypothetical protein
MSPEYVGSGRAKDGHKYEPVFSSEHEARDQHRRHSIEDPAALDLDRHLKAFRQNNRKRVAFRAMGAIGAILFLYWAIA